MREAVARPFDALAETPLSVTISVGLTGFTIIASLELGRYGVTANAVAPAALTRLTEDLGMGQASDEMKEMMSNPDREKAGRATAAMMKMKKLDVGELRKAFDGEGV